MYQLWFYVPATDLESVKKAIFAKGAGRLGNYDYCCWQTLGQGQFKPKAGSDPAIGEQGELETVAEYKVEVVCEDHLINDVIQALKEAHPYEVPAYTAWKVDAVAAD